MLLHVFLGTRGDVIRLVLTLFSRFLRARLTMRPVTLLVPLALLALLAQATAFSWKPCPGTNVPSAVTLSPDPPIIGSPAVFNISLDNSGTGAWHAARDASRCSPASHARAKPLYTPFNCGMIARLHAVYAHREQPAGQRC